ncbi:MAG: hypothetical protein LBL71_01650 [Endomicrobium sp.]|nr:hypothetical protein [Endomicrobium sp.]
MPIEKCSAGPGKEIDKEIRDALAELEHRINERCEGLKLNQQEIQETLQKINEFENQLEKQEQRLNAFKGQQERRLSEFESRRIGGIEDRVHRLEREITILVMAHPKQKDLLLTHSREIEELRQQIAVRNSNQSREIMEIRELCQEVVEIAVRNSDQSREIEELHQEIAVRNSDQNREIGELHQHIGELQHHILALSSDQTRDIKRLYHHIEMQDIQIQTLGSRIEAQNSEMMKLGNVLRDLADSVNNNTRNMMRNHDLLMSLLSRRSQPPLQIPK